MDYSWEQFQLWLVLAVLLFEAELKYLSFLKKKIYCTKAIISSNFLCCNSATFYCSSFLWLTIFYSNFEETLKLWTEFHSLLKHMTAWLDSTEKVLTRTRDKSGELMLEQAKNVQQVCFAV